MKDKVCLYHSRDLDGYTSGAIIKKKFPDIELIGWDYGQPIPDIKDKELVIMADISFNDMEDMYLLSKNNGGNLIWIDHHISAIKKYQEFEKEYGDFLLGKSLDTNQSACELCWEYLFPDEEMPIGINYLGIWDTFRGKDDPSWESKILPFQYGMRAVCNSPKTTPDAIFEYNNANFISDTIDYGKMILKYVDIANKDQSKFAFETEAFGLRAICLNTTSLGSDLFNGVWNPEKHDIMLVFKYDGKKWKFSIYTEKKDIDVSEFAKSKGGGGHKGASGFEVEILSDILPDIKI